MDSANYKFNPEEYGYEKSEKFPELKGIVGKHSYVKVVEVGKYKPVNYIYSVCFTPAAIFPKKQHWSFNIMSYSAVADKKALQVQHHKFSGLITSKEFAEMLLPHVMGAENIADFEEKGIKRAKNRLNDIRLDIPEFEEYIENV